MNTVFNLIFKICILLIISSIIAAITEHTKNGRLVRSVASAALVLAMVSVVSSVKSTEITDFSSEKFAVNESEVWAAAAAEISKQLENEMYKLCVSNAVSVDAISVTVTTDGANFEVKRVDITGSGAQRAKNLIAGYFKIGAAYINSNGAG